MARPSKLSPTQWDDIGRRLAAGESPSDLAREYGIHPAQITRKFSQVTQKVQSVAQSLAKAQDDLAALPVAQQYAAVSLAEKLRNISASLASAAELGAKTSHRLHALANAEVEKVDDAAPLSPESLGALKGVSLLTKLANDSSVIPLNLLNANKGQKPEKGDEGEQSGVLVVPGLAADPDAWSEAVQGQKA